MSACGLLAWLAPSSFWVRAKEAWNCSNSSSTENKLPCKHNIFNLDARDYVSPSVVAHLQDLWKKEVWWKPNALEDTRYSRYLIPNCLPTFKMQPFRSHWIKVFPAKLSLGNSDQFRQHFWFVPTAQNTMRQECGFANEKQFGKSQRY